jgi:hypothetical protein
MIASDITTRVTNDFDRPDEAGLVLSVLEDFQKQNPDLSSDRIIRCMVQVANGDLDRLDQAIELAVVDYRDLIVWAEYDENRLQIRDLSKPFASR